MNSGLSYEQARLDAGAKAAGHSLAPWKLIFDQVIDDGITRRRVWQACCTDCVFSVGVKKDGTDDDWREIPATMPAVVSCPMPRVTLADYVKGVPAINYPQTSQVRHS